LAAKVRIINWKCIKWFVEGGGIMLIEFKSHKAYSFIFRLITKPHLMKTTLITFAFFIAITALTISCNKTPNKNLTVAVGTIVGQDIRMCSCCGGYIIEIDGKQYLIQDDISKEVAYTTKLPAMVNIMYKPSTNSCGLKIIEVESIALQ
jgi:hypothetical protein